MNIIILEDKKGFRKMIEVPNFPPQYVLPVVVDISVDLAKEKPFSEAKGQTLKSLQFIPMSSPINNENLPDVSIIIYKEQSF